MTAGGVANAGNTDSPSKAIAETAEVFIALFSPDDGGRLRAPAPARRGRSRYGSGLAAWGRVRSDKYRTAAPAPPPLPPAAAQKRRRHRSQDNADSRRSRRRAASIQTNPGAP